MAKPSTYWDKRAIKRLTDAERQSEEYIKRIQKMYDRANKNIQRDIENIYRNYSKDTGLDVQSLKTLLTKTETDKLWQELQAKGLDKYVKENYKARISRLEKLQAQIYAKAKELYPEEQKAHTECYKGVINDSYYKAIYDTQMGTGYDFAFSNLDDNLVKAMLNERWSGKNYSQRIWGNTDILAESLSEVIGGGMLSGQSMAKTSRQVRERFNVSKYYAERLVRTEVNHFNNEADAMAYEEMDVEKYVFLATLDTRTSTICQNLDNKVFELKKRRVGENYPPMHVNCRSKTRAYMGEEIEKTLKRRARNPFTNETEIIDNIPYSEWAKKHGINQVEQSKNLTNNTKGSIIKTSEVQQRLKKSGIKYNKVHKHKIQPTESQIIDRLSGYDSTNGSCSSLAFAYAGNKNGLNVLDFRGGKSCDYFARTSNIVKISRLPNVKSFYIEGYDDYVSTVNLLKNAVDGKEYYLATGSHCAIVRKLNGVYEYLELQLQSGNGFKRLDPQVLEKRFECQHSYTSNFTNGQKYKVRNVLIDIDSLKGNKEFEKILGYINTADKKQLKGGG